MILLIALVTLSSCNEDEFKEIDFYHLEFISGEYQWCIPVEIEGKLECAKTMSIKYSLGEGMIGVTSDNFKELTNQYNQLKRECDNGNY